MIGKHVKELLTETEDTFLIEAENVATVLYTHPLEHALLVLTNVGYSKIPVLDSEDYLVGLLSLADIMRAISGLTGFDMSLLESLTVADVMEVNVTTIHQNEGLEVLLRRLVNEPFLPYVTAENVFLGIYTRKTILKSVNHMVHEIESRYYLIEKNEQKKAQ
ncbi:CBS domain-containing protein [Enterococcus cecorum]|uniref:cyclic-di-AMP-binding protein CbpB n=1 Tax=Enterococcus cecorum TaxID=44008 RepID=UPI000642E206|nr:cyclic-di-AMP-binding protein CbpB [Enterococcus cecorum]KLO64629.1 CBS domain-containing protein [Enterococcus cecorum]CAI3437963.1 CBS domain-containing protein [Enterococcus cecorum]